MGSKSSFRRQSGANYEFQDVKWRFLSYIEQNEIKIEFQWTYLKIRLISNIGPKYLCII